MFTQSELSFPEEKFLNKFSACAKFQITMVSLLNGWQNFVADVEGGYSFGIEDYTNDLTLRDLIEEIARGSADTLREKIISAVKPSDEKFRSITQTIKRPLFKVDSDELWWWFRIPVKLGIPLQGDLKVNGFIK